MPRTLCCWRCARIRVMDWRALVQWRSSTWTRAHWGAVPAATLQVNRAAAARHLGRVAARAQLFAICMQLCCESFVSDPSCFEGEVPFCLLG